MTRGELKRETRGKLRGGEKGLTLAAAEISALGFRFFCTGRQFPPRVP